MAEERLDVALVNRGLVRSRSRARTLIDEGRVRIDSAPATRASQLVAADAVLAADDADWVSRAAHKLLGALDDLDVRPAGRALDVGASTGGFTQVLRARGCAPVFALDVGHGQLDPTVAQDPAVVVHEGVNGRDLTLAHTGGEPVDLVVADVSFISLTLLVGPIADVVRVGGTALLMVKPQFEVGRERLGRGGVVRDAGLHEWAVRAVATAAVEAGLTPQATAESRLPGPAGNKEFFLLLRK